MNKKAYMKTVEAIISLVLVLSVVVTIINRNQVSLNDKPREIEIMQETVSHLIQSNEDLRKAVLLEQNDTIDAAIQPYFNNVKTLNYDFIICDPSYCPSLTGLPKDRSIYVSTLVISSTREQYSNKVFKLYIWRKVE